jgi:hypothetical protein
MFLLICDWVMAGLDAFGPPGAAHLRKRNTQSP